MLARPAGGVEVVGIRKDTRIVVDMDGGHADGVPAGMVQVLYCRTRDGKMRWKRWELPENMRRVSNMMALRQGSCSSSRRLSGWFGSGM